MQEKISHIEPVTGRKIAFRLQILKFLYYETTFWPLVSSYIDVVAHWISALYLKHKSSKWRKRVCYLIHKTTYSYIHKLKKSFLPRYSLLFPLWNCILTPSIYLYRCSTTLNFSCLSQIYVHQMEEKGLCHT